MLTRPAALASAGLAFVLMGPLAACTSPGGDDVPSPSAPAAPTPGEASRACQDEKAMSEVVRTFLAAYNAGEAGLADRFFAPAGTFQWYSEHRRRQSPDAYDRSTLERYLQKRHA